MLEVGRDPGTKRFIDVLTGSSSLPRVGSYKAKPVPSLDALVVFVIQFWCRLNRGY
jgi:hypothetical protein